ncbi:hypothetical protein HDU96_001462, partial [Phlyctochytrium bullatum]
MASLQAKPVPALSQHDGGGDDTTDTVFRSPAPAAAATVPPSAKERPPKSRTLDGHGRSNDTMAGEQGDRGSAAAGFGPRGAAGSWRQRGPGSGDPQAAFPHYGGGGGHWQHHPHHGDGGQAAGRRAHGPRSDHHPSTGHHGPSGGPASSDPGASKPPQPRGTGTRRPSNPDPALLNNAEEGTGEGGGPRPRAGSSSASSSPNPSPSLAAGALGGGGKARRRSGTGQGRGGHAMASPVMAAGEASMGRGGGTELPGAK